MIYLIQCIAHIDVLQLIKIAEDWEFLTAQREPGRQGFMAGVDKVLEAKEAQSFRRQERISKNWK